MDASHLTTRDTADPIDQFDSALRHERDGLREFLAAADRQFDEAQDRLLDLLDRFAAEAAGGRHEEEAARRDADQRAAQLAQEAEHLDRLRADLDARRSEWQHAAEQTAQYQESLLESLRQEQQALERQRAEFERRQAECIEAERAGRELLQQEVAAARGERKRLESAGQEHPQAKSDSELERRYQLALDDLRELKAENAQLEEQLSKARGAPPTTKSASADGSTLNWEAEKQRILAELESEADEEDEAGRENRADVERIVRRTERIVAEKDAEIAELKQLLDNQSTSVGSLAVGAAALGEMLDQDAMIQEERRNLAALKEQWREKLRKAEVEMSVERAKLARQRTEIEEKLRRLEERAASMGNTPDSDSATGKPPRNRWLTRLGLKDSQSSE